MRHAFLLLSLIFSPMLTGCGGGDAAKPASSAVEAVDLQLLLQTSGTKTLTGALLNRTEQRIANVQVQVNLYDADNRQVDDFFFTVRNLEPGDSTRFSEPVESDFDVRSARVAGYMM